MLSFRSFFNFIKSMLLTLLVSMLCPLTASAAVDIYKFDTDSQRDRYHLLSEELRCPKCQNQNLAGSNSQISEDLRRELHRLLIEGKSDTEIKAFMVARYGDFVLYKPPLKSSTMALWLFPVVLLLGGAIALFFIIRQRTRSLIKSDDNSLSDSEQQQLDELLKKASSGGELSASTKPLANKVPDGTSTNSVNKNTNREES
jgi:cytochrome c-type biogenesis protein CcmH